MSDVQKPAISDEAIALVAALRPEQKDRLCELVIPGHTAQENGSHTPTSSDGADVAKAIEKNVYSDLLRNNMHGYLLQFAEKAMEAKRFVARNGVTLGEDELFTLMEHAATAQGRAWKTNLGDGRTPN